MFIIETEFGTAKVSPDESNGDDATTLSRDQVRNRGILDDAAIYPGKFHKIER
jgi:hypothetical protein